jgi:hypothetical protein
MSLSFNHLEENPFAPSAVEFDAIYLNVPAKLLSREAQIPGTQ